MRRARGRGCLLKDGRVQFYGPLGNEPLHQFKETLKRDPSWDDARFDREREKYLAKRIRDVYNDADALKAFVPLQNQKILFNDLLAELSDPQGEKHLKEFFAGVRINEITRRTIEKYIEQRLETAQPGTINRELSAVRAVFKRAVSDQVVAKVPEIRHLKEENVREGFVTKQQLDGILAHVENEDHRDFLDFSFWSAWRKGEVGGLEWKDVNLELGLIVLPARQSKNGVARPIPIIGLLEPIIRRRLARRRLDCPLVFHKDGEVIYKRNDDRIKGVWAAAAEKAGCPEIIHHDLRRSGIVAMSRSGMADKIIMQISGHKTVEVFMRYRIVDLSDVTQALLTMEKKYAETASVSGSVVPFTAKEEGQ